MLYPKSGGEIWRYRDRTVLFRPDYSKHLDDQVSECLGHSRFTAISERVYWHIFSDAQFKFLGMFVIPTTKIESVGILSLMILHKSGIECADICWVGNYSSYAQYSVCQKKGGS